MTEDIQLADQAAWTKERIITVKNDIETNSFILAKLLCEMRDFRLWEFLDCDSMEEFLGMPEIGLRRSTVYGLMKLYDCYIAKLQIPEDLLSEVGTTKLLIMTPVIEKEGDKEKIYEWIGNAKVWSKSDLREQVAAATGATLLKPPKQLPPAVATSLESCCVCGREPTDKHHFPITRGAGCPENWAIPLCRQCHSEYHANPKDWLWDNRRKWAANLYGRIEVAERRYAELVEVTATRTDQAKGE